ncbi:MAG: SH3 domain-containing protein [Myxococcota bacterium]
MTRIAPFPLALVLTLALGCATPPNEPSEPIAKATVTTPDESLVYLRAEADRAIFLEREVERLRDDLEAAEEALIAVESGLNSSYTRATAVSALAEARISVQRAEAELPYLPEVVAEAHGKLEKADSQLAEGHLGAAICFATRAHRISQSAVDDALEASGQPDVRFIAGNRVNLREGPSTEHAVAGQLHRGTPVFPERAREDWLLLRTVRGRVGWVHAPLVSAP